MKNLKYLIFGTYFGVVITKAEVISWFRIQEMFRFHSFHMYGVLFTAIIVGAVSILIIKKFKVRSLDGSSIELGKKKLTMGTALGGLLFGMGWSITGACPGPLYALLGNGFTVIIITILFALLGAWMYGLLRDRIPS